jgi:aryl-alcohol dehydrogenase-like predicted oxidoreductase
LKVSRFWLGTMQWGWTVDEQTADAVMDAFVEHGGNFLDTADFYSRWLPGHTGRVRPCQDVYTTTGGFLKSLT